MTTIAYDGALIAWDSQTTDGNLKSTCAYDKVSVINGKIYAACGNADSALSAILWHRKGAKLAQWNSIFPPSPQFEMLVIDPKQGAMWYSDNDRRGIPLKAPIALGSGADFALGAILAGKNAMEAVEIAARLDVFTGGEISTINVPATFDMLKKQKARKARTKRRPRAR